MEFSLNENINKPSILHFVRGDYKRFVNESFELGKYKITNSLSIVNIKIGDVVDILSKQIDNDSSLITITEKEESGWFNVYKIKYILEGLKKSVAEYSLILDCRDILISDNVSEIIPIFNATESDILISSGRAAIPAHNKLELNSGAIIGKTDSLIRFFSYLQDNVTDFIRIFKKTSIWQSDQAAMSYLIDGYMKLNQDTIKIDKDSIIFRTITPVSKITVDGNNLHITN